MGCGYSADRVAVDLVPGAQKSGASAVRIDAVIRIENLNGMGFRLDIMISKNAQGGLPGWDRNPELPAALCKRKNGFKQSGKRLPRSPKISRRRAPKLGREDGKTPSVLGLRDRPEGKPISKNKGEAAKDRMKKGHTGDPGITDRKALKSSREISTPKAAVDSEKRIRYP